MLGLGLNITRSSGRGAISAISLTASTVLESATQGTVIGALSSTFGQAPRTFSILTDADSKFAVSGTDLVVRTAATFDHETAGFHLVTVRVTDNLAATADVTFTILVTDVNEVPTGANGSATVIVSIGTAPVLSSPLGTKAGSTTANLGVTTDRGNGTIWWVVTTSATQPSTTQIKAGQDHTGAAAADSASIAITSTGAKTASADGLTANTTYYAHYYQEDVFASASNRSSSASFTTDAVSSAPVKQSSGQLFNNSTDPTPVLTSSNLTLAAGETLIVRIAPRRTTTAGTTMTFDAVTFNGNAMAQGATNMPATNAPKVCSFIYTYRSASGETGPVVIDISADIAGEALGAFYDIYSGVHATTPVGATASSFSNDVTSQQLNITTANANSVVLYAFAIDRTTANTSSSLSGATQDDNFETGSTTNVENICIFATEAAATAATYDATVTNTAAAKVSSCAIELRAA